MSCLLPRPSLSQSKDLGLRPRSQRSLRRGQDSRSHGSLLVQSPPLDTGVWLPVGGPLLYVAICPVPQVVGPAFQVATVCCSSWGEKALP